MNKDNWDSDNGATQCDMEAEMRARKTEDLHKWSDEDLEYEICDRVTEYMDSKPYMLGTNSIEMAIMLFKKIKPFTDEFRRRHPIPEQYDENGNYKGN